MDQYALNTEDFGRKLSVGGNWESDVYELGDQQVIKIIKLPDSIDPETPDYDERVVLQKFWNTELHFKNTIDDYAILKKHLENYLPDTQFYRSGIKPSENVVRNFCIQKKINGEILSWETLSKLRSAKEFDEKFCELCRRVQVVSLEMNAPLDFHPGNLSWGANDGKLLMFDTGTPSDWEYFLDAERIAATVGVTSETAERFVSFMDNIQKIHFDNMSRIESIGK